MGICAAMRCRACSIVSPRPVPVGQPRKLLFGRAPGDDQEFQFLIESRFDQQRGLHHGNGVRVGSFDRGKLAALLRKNRRMHDGV